MKHRLPLFAAAVALLIPASASAFTIAPAGTGASTSGRIAIAPAGDGGALLTWATRTASGMSVQTSRLSAAGAFGAPQTVLQAPVVDFEPFGAVQDNDSATVLTTRGDKVTTDVVAVRRDPNQASYGAPLVLSTTPFASVLASASNRRGDMAVVYSDGSRRSKLVTVLANGTISVPQALGTEGGLSQNPAVAVGQDGALVVAYHDGDEVVARTGAIGSALGQPQTLAATSTYPDISAAIDDTGRATVAYSRAFGHTAIGIAAARAAAGHSFGKARTLDNGPNAQFPKLAAGGSTTALTWSDVTSTNPPRVAIAHGRGSFGKPQAPGTPEVRLHGEAGRFPSVSGVPVPAVSHTGDVLIAYPYGPYSASTHAVSRSAYASKFSKPRVVSALGHGGYPSVGLPGNRPLVAFSDGDAVFGYTRLPQAHPDLTPAGLTESALSAAELRRDGKVTTTIRCSEDCFVGSQSRLTTGRRGESVGQVISRQHRDPVILKAGVPMRVTYELSDKGKTALADTGRAEAKVIVTMTNRSGASRTTRRLLELGK